MANALVGRGTALRQVRAAPNSFTSSIHVTNCVNLFSFEVQALGRLPELTEVWSASDSVSGMPPTHPTEEPRRGFESPRPTDDNIPAHRTHSSSLATSGLYLEHPALTDCVFDVVSYVARRRARLRRCELVAS